MTVPDVISEIKNKRQLKRLCVLPYELTVRDPFPENVQHVTEFAKKTGDYLSLSAADIKVIALTYELEKEIVGVEHLRQNPVVSKTFSTKEVPEELLPQGKIIGFYNPGSDEEDEEEDQEEEEEDEDEEVKQDNNESAPKKSIEDSKSNEAQETPEVAKGTEEKDEEYDEVDEKLIEQFTKLQCDQENILTSVNPSTDKPEKEENSETEPSEESEEEDDDDSWITPSNFSQAKKMFGNEVVEEDAADVACMSTDYAVQNVLKQINLNVASLDGRIIKQMRTYILRCFTCFKTTSIMTKVFCPKCGNKTLKRVAVSIDENGQQVVSLQQIYYETIFNILFC